MKVTLDQLGDTALFATPVICILYDWKHNQYRLRDLGHVISLKYYREAVFPVLLTNWAVWIPDAYFRPRAFHVGAALHMDERKPPPRSRHERLRLRAEVKALAMPSSALHETIR